jgi:hypothetical protein
LPRVAFRSAKRIVSFSTAEAPAITNWDGLNGVDSAPTVHGTPMGASGRYRPIDIDRSPFMIETRRVYGALEVHRALEVHGTLTCVSTQKLLCRLALRRGVFPTPSRSRLGCDRDRAWGAESDGRNQMSLTSFRHPSLAFRCQVPSPLCAIRFPGWLGAFA